MRFTAEQHEAMIAHLRSILRFKTVSFCEGMDFPAEEFLALHRFIRDTYPLVTEHTQLDVIDGFTLLYRWQGKTDGKPVMLMAHQDVVPAQEEDWLHGPFSGDIADGCVWGRGAIDMKCQLTAILEACEKLMAEGFVPENDVYLLFTHNEEGQNETGAQETAKLLKERGIRMKYIVDEGGYAFGGERYGMAKDGIHVSLCEKGYADIVVSADDPGGHASTPPKSSALGRVCRAVSLIEQNPLKPFLNDANKALLNAVRQYSSAKNARIEAFAGEPNKNALIRTTVAPTMMGGSNAPNVLPGRAWANLNVRLLPGQTIEEVVKALKATVKAVDVQIDVVKATPPTPVSQVDSDGYRAICSALASVYPDLAVIPGIMTGATDSRFFVELADNIFRISPFDCTKTLLSTMHGVNERIEVDSYLSGVAFFEELIRTF